MPGFGPFKSPFDALMKACPFLLSLPHAVGQRLDETDPAHELSWHQSTEYCAWVYYTPDDNYEMSWVITPDVQDEIAARHCSLPPRVHDSRYPDDSIRYVYAIHTHPFPEKGRLSEGDILYILRQGERHGRAFVNREGIIKLANIAFFRKPGLDGQHCSSFYQYTPMTGELQEWTLGEDSTWKVDDYGRVTSWRNERGELKVKIVK